MRNRLKKVVAVILITMASMVGLLMSPPAYAEGDPINVTPGGPPVEAPGTPTRLSVPDTTLTISGFAAPNAFVTLFDADTPVGTVVAGPDGRFTKVLTAQKEGIHTIKAFYGDTSGRTSTSVTRNISVTHHVNTLLELFLPPTIEVQPNSVIEGDLITFRGSTVPGATVNVTIDGNTVVVGTADSRGNWSIVVDTENYFLGTHVFNAFASLDNRTSPKTIKDSFEVRRVSREDILEDLPPQKISPPVIIEPPDGTLLSSPDVLIIGTAEPNSQVEVYVDGVLAGSVFSNSQGRWTFNLEMTKPEHTIDARMCANSACSEKSNQITLVYRGDFAGCDLSFRLQEYRFFGLRQRNGLDLAIAQLSAAGQYEMIIDWGDTVVEKSTLYHDKSGKLHHVYKDLGNFNGSITIVDENNCDHTQYFAVEILPNRRLNWWWLLLALIPPLAAVFYRSTRRLYRIRVRYVN